MATVNKDFKIKSGLIVEGTTATVNGYDILTKKQGDQDYIIGLIGGSASSEATPDTVVLRDGDANFAANNVTVNTLYVGGSTNNGIDVVNGDTELGSTNGILLSANDDITLATSGGDVVLNPDGNSFLWSKSSANQISTQGYVDGEISSLDTAAQGYATTAENNAKGYADSLATNYDAAGSASSAQSAAQLYADGVAGDAYTNAVADAASDATTKANNAESNANDYTDGAITQEVSDRNSAISTAITNLDLAGTYDALGAATTAENNAKAYTDQEVAALVDSAPALLDTLNELAAAIADNPNYATDVANLIADKADTSYVNQEISDLDTAAQGYATSAENAAKGYADSLATNYDAAGAATTAYNNAVSYTDGEISSLDTTAQGYATTAENNAKGYADSLAVNYDAAGSASTAQGNAETFATNAINALTTDDIEEGITNQYFLDSRAKTSAADLLTGASLTNITITGSGAGLTITAENGVADSTTDDLAEGSTNKYFTDSRVLGAIDGSSIQPSSVQINWARTENATWTPIATASQVVCHQAGGGTGSMKYLIRTISNAGGVEHSQVTEVLATVDGNKNVAVTEYGTIYTSENPLSSVTVLWNNLTNCYELNVTTANNNSEVMVAATLMAYAD